MVVVDLIDRTDSREQTHDTLFFDGFGRLNRTLLDRSDCHRLTAVGAEGGFFVVGTTAIGTILHGCLPPFFMFVPLYSALFSLSIPTLLFVWCLLNGRHVDDMTPHNVLSKKAFLACMVVSLVETLLNDANYNFLFMMLLMDTSGETIVNKMTIPDIN
jgi:hypothetical protein